MFEILVLISVIGVISAISAIISGNKRRAKAQRDLERFERHSPSKGKVDSSTSSE